MSTRAWVGTLAPGFFILVSLVRGLRNRVCLTKNLSVVYIHIYSIGSYIHIDWHLLVCIYLPIYWALLRFIIFLEVYYKELAHIVLEAESPEVCHLQAEHPEKWWWALRSETDEESPSLRADVPAQQPGRESTLAPPLTFCSIRALMDWMGPTHLWEGHLLYLSTDANVTLSCKRPWIMLHQISGHPVTQSRWRVTFTILPGTPVPQPVKCSWQQFYPEGSSYVVIQKQPSRWPSQVTISGQQPPLGWKKSNNMGSDNAEMPVVSFLSRFHSAQNPWMTLLGLQPASLW